MNNFEVLEQEICDQGLQLDTISFSSDRIKGIYVDGVIALNSKLRTVAEKACIAAEELAHSKLSTGVILDMKNPWNRKQEYSARMQAYNSQIGLIGIIRGYMACCQSRYELAEYLGVTEDFLQDAIDSYCSKYGAMKIIDNYIILFEPVLSVLERYD